MNYIGNKIRVLMMFKGFNIPKMAELTNLDRYQIDNILQGRSKKIDLIQKVAKALGVSLDYLCAVPDNIEQLNLSDKQSDMYTECMFYTDVYADEYKLNLSEGSKQKIFFILKEHNPKFPLEAGSLAAGVHGIILLLKKFPKFINEIELATEILTNKS